MKKISPGDVKRLMLDMLCVFAELCEQNGLRYILDYGTLLGGVRHDGFIPWDDDIDVSMPRDDYDRLYKLFTEKPELLGSCYRLSAYDNEYTTQKPILNLIDTRTVTISVNRVAKYYYPVWIDIFPMDHVYKQREETKNKVQKCGKLLHLCQMAYNPGGNTPLRPLKRILYMTQMIHLNSRLEKINTIAKSGTDKGTELANYMSPYGIKDISNISFYEHYVYHHFEDGEFRIPEEYDLRLSALYGDYMELPPEDKRCPHVTEAYWLDDFHK